jgi:hypothetical protein
MTLDNRLERLEPLYSRPELPELPFEETWERLIRLIERGHLDPGSRDFAGRHELRMILARAITRHDKARAGDQVEDPPDIARIRVAVADLVAEG